MTHAFLLDDRGLIRVGGPEARPFLQALISNDIAGVSDGHAVYAALLTPQGKYLFDFILYMNNDNIIVDTEMHRRNELMQRLIMYRMRSKVTIEQVENAWVVVAPPGAEPPSDVILSAADPRHAGLGTRAAVAATHAVGTSSAAHRLAYDRLRISLGVPDGSRDMEIGKAVLLENNFEELHGVDFAKGCFIGQELTARMKYRALVKKRLMPVRLRGPAPEIGTPIMRGDREAGEVRSSAGDLALALLRLEMLDGEPLVAVDTTIEPLPLPSGATPPAAP